MALSLRARVSIGSAALFVANVFVCRELFFLEYSRHMGSIEAAYIGLSRWMLDHPSDLGWFPLWYTGVPAQNTYPPLLHWLVAATAALTGGSTAWAHHFVSAVFYALGPVSAYWLAGRLSGRWGAAFVAGLVYSFVTPSLFLTQEIYGWTRTLWNPTRLVTVLEFGEGPHITALTLLPVALVALDRALEQPRPLRCFLAAAALASVALSNWLGTFALALAAAAYLLARLGDPSRLRRIALSAGIALAAYLIASPWIPPSTLAAVRRNAQQVAGEYPMTAAHLLYWAVALGVAALVWLLCRRSGAGRMFGFSALFTTFLAALVLPYDRFGLSLMPQPFRYHLEFDLAVVWLLVFAASAAVRDWSPRRRLVAAALVGLVLIPQILRYRGRAGELIQPIEIETTVERQVADFLKSRLPGRRVFAAGSIEFWLNAFTDNPQVGGGFAQGIINRQIPIVHFGVPYTPDDGADTAVWLRLYGARAVVVSWPNGRDWYPQNWVTPDKFEGVLPLLWRAADGGEAVYGVPQRSDSLVYAIRPGDAVAQAPINNKDFEPVRALDAAMADESLPLVAVEWETPSRGVLRADLEADQRLFVQIAHHPGWTATRDGRELPIEPDGLGFFVITPGCDGPCEVRLEYDGGIEMKLAKGASLLTLLGFGVWGLWMRKPWATVL